MESKKRVAVIGWQDSPLQYNAQATGNTPITKKDLKFVADMGKAIITGAKTNRAGRRKAANARKKK